eukprot:1161171-Pelagomonas_calceolata.AAC.12
MSPPGCLFCRKLLMGVDLTKGFYFSFTYHLAATLQYNYQAGLAGAYAAAAASTSSQKQGQFSSSGKGPKRGKTRNQDSALCGRLHCWCMQP